MKKLLLLSIGILSLGLLTMSYQGGVSGQSTTGCSCHGAADVNTNILLAGFPSSGYEANTTYTLILNVTNTTKTKAGIDVTVTGGTMHPVTNCKLVGSDLTHSSPVTMTNGTAAFVFTWQAPAAATGDVEFKVAANAVNGDGTTAGDAFNLSTFTVAEAVPTSVNDIAQKNLQIFPNPAQNQARIKSHAPIEELTLYNQVGQKMQVESKNISESEYLLDLSDLAPAIYILQWTQDGVRHSTQMHKI